MLVDGPGVIRARFIPAPAGNGSWATSTFRTTTVHPRACGERYRGCSRSLGSSPRLRGTGLRAVLDGSGKRFIPAPAGNGGCNGPGGQRARFIPAPAGNGNGAETGSSPRLRGTGQVLGLDLDDVRFIPAPAGNGWRIELQSVRMPVHPRACGERYVGNDQDEWINRRFIPAPAGNGKHRSDTDLTIRFIPAPAGNGPIFSAMNRRTTVHPRACGEPPVHPRACGERIAGDVYTRRQ